MPKFESPLNNISIASPCSANWNEMYGDNCKRFCGDCKLNVYNLSGMRRDEAEALITNAEGRLCVRFYRRADGSVITQDCPVGWARLKHRTKIWATAFASMVMALLTGLLFASMTSRQEPNVGALHIPTPKPTPTPERVMGIMANREPNHDPGENLGGLSFPVDRTVKNRKTKPVTSPRPRQ